MNKFGVFNATSFSNSIDKLDLFFKDEYIIFEKIDNILNSLSVSYNSNNSQKINNLNDEYISKLKIISKNHEGQLQVLRKVESNNALAIKNTIKSFEKIDGVDLSGK